MTQQRLKTPAWALIGMALLGVALGACDGSSTSPLDDPLLFQGQLLADGSVEHTFVLSAEGLVRVEVVSLDEVVAEGGTPATTTWQIGLAIGRPDDEGCGATYTIRAEAGQTQVLGLNAAEYCLRLFDAGVLPDETVLDYTVMLSPSN